MCAVCDVNLNFVLINYDYIQSYHHLSAEIASVCILIFNFERGITCYTEIATWYLILSKHKLLRISFSWQKLTISGLRHWLLCSS